MERERLHEHMEQRQRRREKGAPGGQMDPKANEGLDGIKFWRSCRTARRTCRGQNIGHHVLGADWPKRVAMVAIVPAQGTTKGMRTSNRTVARAAMLALVMCLGPGKRPSDAKGCRERHVGRRSTTATLLAPAASTAMGDSCGVGAWRRTGSGAERGRRTRRR